MGFTEASHADEIRIPIPESWGEGVSVKVTLDGDRIVLERLEESDENQLPHRFTH